MEEVIIIPSYQPDERLVTTVNELFEYFHKIIVVDDGSGSEYGDIFAKVEDKAVLITYGVNRGKGHALKEAFSFCGGNPDFATAGVITVDGDGQHRAADVVRIATAMEDNPGKLVLGARSFNDKNIPLRSRFGNKMSRIVYGLCGIGVVDTQTGLRGLPADFVSVACNIPGERYEYETNMLIEAGKYGLGFFEVPIETIYENNNEVSHFNPIMDSIKIYRVIIKYCMSSLIGMLVDYVVFALGLWFGVSILFSTYGARVCSCIVNFILNRNVVFKHKDNIAVQFIKYALLALVSGTASGLLVTYLDSISGVHAIFLKMIVESVLFFVNYFVQKKFIFAKGRDKEKDNNEER